MIIITEASSIFSCCRRKAGQKALREIRFFQKTTHFLPKLTFCRVIKEVMMESGAGDMRIQSIAIEALQEATEAFLVRLLEEANLCAVHSKRPHYCLKTWCLSRSLNIRI